jgi:uncharacterized membrane protein YidH (DUF202 family)
VTTPASPGDELLGTQAERTELAWVRTTLACAALAALSGRLADVDVNLAVPLGLGLLIALPGAVASVWRTRALRRHPEPPPPSAAGVAMLAGSVVLADVVVLALLLA